MRYSHRMGHTWGFDFFDEVAGPRQRALPTRAVLARVAAAAVTMATAAGLLGPATAAAAPPAPGTVIGTDALPPMAQLPGTASQRRLTYWTEGPTGAPALSTGAVYLPS